MPDTASAVNEVRGETVKPERPGPSVLREDQDRRLIIKIALDEQPHDGGLARMCVFYRTLMGSQQAADRKVFVQIGPVDAYPVTNQSEATPFGGSCVKQFWKPTQRNFKFPSIHQLDDKFLGCYLNLLRSCFKRYRSSHSICPQSHFFGPQ